LWRWCQMWMVCSFCIFVCVLVLLPIDRLMRFMASSCSLGQSHLPDKKAMHASWPFPQIGPLFGQLAP
jgi:hypothetical protein